MQKILWLGHNILLLSVALIISACSDSSVVINSQPTIQLPLETKTVITVTETKRSTPTTVLDIDRFANSWARYQDGIYGISFEYPTIYEEIPFQGTCDPIDAMDGVDFGETSEVFIRQQLSTSLDEHIRLFIKTYFPDKKVRIASQEATQISERSAVVLKFTLDDANESREFVFIADPETKLVYTFSFIGGSACDIPELRLSEQIVFQHALDTFQIEK